MRELFFVAKCFVLACVLTVLSQLHVKGKTVEDHLLHYIGKRDITKQATQFSKESLDYLRSEKFLKQAKCTVGVLKENIGETASDLTNICNSETENCDTCTEKNI